MLALVLFCVVVLNTTYWCNKNELVWWGGGKEKKDFIQKKLILCVSVRLALACFISNINQSRDREKKAHKKYKYKYKYGYAYTKEWYAIVSEQRTAHK